MSEVLENLTGWQNPVFEVYRKSDNVKIETIELDFTNGEGLVVEYEDVYSDEEELIDYTNGENDVDIILDADYLGTRYYWTFNWTEQVKRVNGLKIKRLLDYRIGNENYFKCKPRKDGLKYTVIKDPETMTLRAGKGEDKSSGDEGFSMRWKTHGLIKTLDWRDGNLSQYTGRTEEVLKGQQTI